MLKWRRSETVASLEVLVQTSHHEGLLNNPGLTLNTGALNIFEKLICVVLFEAHTHTHTQKHTSHALQQKLITGNRRKETCMSIPAVNCFA